MGSDHKRTPLETAFTEVGQTDVSRATAWTITIVFLLTLAAVPLIDVTDAIRRGQLRATDTISDALSAGFTFPIHQSGVQEHNPLHDVEEAIEDASLVKGTVQPRLQALLSETLDVGNKKVLIGRDGWLFYRPGIDYVVGPGFLSSLQHKIVPRSTPDPRPAIQAFHAACTAAGVRLVLMPIPDKAMVHPEKLVSRTWSVDPPDNPDYTRLLDELPGVEVFRAIATLQDVAKTGPAFLTQDTHWTPEAMEAVAKALGNHVRGTRPGTKHGPRRRWLRESRNVKRVGDLVDSLKLPADQRIFEPQAATMHAVVDPNGQPWRPRESARILLLGDSFTNIYTLPEMGWGEFGGLGPQLSWELDRDIDVIAVNGGGASGALRALAKRDDPLGGKRIIVWQFAVRDLAFENWDVIPIRAKPAREGGTGSIVLIGELMTAPPHVESGDTPYPSAVVFLKFKVRKVINGSYAAPEVLVEMPFILKSKPLEAASYREGGVFRITLTPDVPAEWEGQRTVDETNELDLRPLWAETIHAEVVGKPEK